MTYCYKNEWMKEVTITAENWIEARHELMNQLNIETVNELDYLYEKEVK